MRKGFTLIELLIVVAIIAILAAIAIPNFLQAQTRAKVSRCQADMRTIATALESYYVDHNEYPPDGYQGVPEDTGWWFLNYKITTPVAYLTDAGIEDPFFPPDIYSPEDLEEMPWLPNFRYINYDFLYRDYIDNEPRFQRYNRIYGMWVLISRGPDGRYTFGEQALHDEQGSLWESTMPYDPTNGTVSRGDLVRGQVGEPDYGPVQWDEVYGN